MSNNNSLILKILRRVRVSETEILNLIYSNLTDGSPLMLTYLGFHAIDRMMKDEKLTGLLNSDVELMADGVGIIKLLQILFNIRITPFTTTGIYDIVLARLIKQKTPTAIVGGSPEVHAIITRHHQNEFVFHHHGYFNQTELPGIIDGIKNARVVYIGMGFPMQEFLASAMREKYPDKIFLCVGNFLEFHFGVKKRAGVFFQKHGIEWLHRLFSEPRRLWKRYVIGIPLFILRAANLIFSSRMYN